MQSRHEAPPLSGALKERMCPWRQKPWARMSVAAMRHRRCRVRGFGLTCRSFLPVPCQCLECGRFEVTPASQVRVSGCWSFSIFDAHDLFEQFLFYLCAQFEAPGRLEVLLYFRIAIPDGSSRYYSSRIQNIENLTTHSQSRHKHDFKYGCS